jgi:transcription elongation factor Elf1
LLGGKCEICGYDKAIQAMDFHHIDPTTKSFAISAVTATKSYDTLLNELKKCMLLCANCHREVECGIVLVPENLNIRDKFIDKINKEKEDYSNIKNENYGICSICGKGFKVKWKNNKYCSVECNAIGQQRCPLPEKEELELCLKSMSIRAIAKKYGVSWHTVNKWIGKLKLVCVV